MLRRLTLQQLSRLRDMRSPLSLCLTPSHRHGIHVHMEGGSRVGQLLPLLSTQRHSRHGLVVLGGKLVAAVILRVPRLSGMPQFPPLIRRRVRYRIQVCHGEYAI